MAKAENSILRFQPPLRNAGLRVLCVILLVAIVGFFAISAYHHITQYFELAATDLSVARNRLNAQESLGMVDAVFDVLIHEKVKTWGLFDPSSSLEVTIFELRLGLAIGIINALLAVAMLLSRRRKSLALFVSALWVLGMTAAVVLSNPAVMGDTASEIACNCTGLDLLDFSNVWAELARNGAMIISLLWMAYAWSAPSSSEPQDG